MYYYYWVWLLLHLIFGLLLITFCPRLVNFIAFKHEIDFLFIYKWRYRCIANGALDVFISLDSIHERGLISYLAPIFSFNNRIQSYKRSLRHLISCFLKLLDAVNLTLHLEQLNGLSPVWVLS